MLSAGTRQRNGARLVRSSDGHAPRGIEGIRRGHAGRELVERHGFCLTDRIQTREGAEGTGLGGNGRESAEDRADVLEQPEASQLRRGGEADGEGLGNEGGRRY